MNGADTNGFVFLSQYCTATGTHPATLLCTSYLVYFHCCYQEVRASAVEPVSKSSA
eukprot:COSAG06_NODE_52670_length_304_cov_0.985366_1_plen_55_part_01